MKNIFPAEITNLPEADVPLAGIAAYLSQADTHQIIFMQFETDAQTQEHAHAAQWGIVVEGKTELTIDGVTHIFTKGDSYHIPAGIPHSAKIFAGYADITFFGQKDRYSVKGSE